VTEMITGLDLVEWQLRVASGERLPLDQSRIERRGHAMEARLYAEDPERGFLPSTGRLERLRFPTVNEHVRIDSGVREGDVVSVHYDPMLAKVIVWATDRSAAIDRLRAALEDIEVEGVRTNARFLWEILGADSVRAGDVSTRLLEKELQLSGGAPATEVTEAWLIAAAAAFAQLQDQDGPETRSATPWACRRGFRLNSTRTIRLPLHLGDERHWLRVAPEGDAIEISLAGHSHRVEVAERVGDRIVGLIDGRPFAARVAARDGGTVVRRQCLRFDFGEDTGAEHHASAEHEGHFRAPMPGHVLDLRVAVGDSVTSGSVLLVLEAMKMEHSLLAPWDGTVKSVAVKAGDRVEEGADLVILEPLEQPSLRQPVTPD